MNADKYLEQKSIDFELIQQNKETTGCKEAAEERNVKTSQIVKSLIVEKQGQIFHICIPGDRKLSEKKFGENRMIKPEESKKITGYESGTIHPFSTNKKHFVDERLLEKNKVSHTTGKKDQGVVYKKDEFKKALEKSDFQFEVEDIVVTNQADIQKLEEKGLKEQEARFLVENKYRKQFIKLRSDYNSKRVLQGIRKMHRQQIEFETSELETLLERSEGENNMLKNAEYYAEHGQFPENQDYQLTDVVKQILDQNPEAVEDFQNGKESALNYLLGKVMEKTSGRADPEKARKKLWEELQ